MADKTDRETLIEMYKRNDIKIPSPKEIDQALERVDAMQQLRDDLLDRWRKHLNITVKEFNQLDIDQVYNDIDNYGIDKLLDDDGLISHPPIKHPKEILFLTEQVNRDIFNFRGHEYMAKLKSTHSAYINYGILFNDENVKIGAKLNTIDELVHRGIVTLYAESENKDELVFSIATLHRTMVRNKDAKLTKNYNKKIVESIKKMATTLVEIEVQEELENTNYKNLDMKRPRITSNLINMAMLEGYQHGTRTTLIKLNSAPILYDYANRKNQVARIPNVLLNIPKINMSENNLILVDYLAAEIQYMKKGNRNRHINYDNLYKKLGILDGTKQQKERVRIAISKYIIPHWKKQGWIIGAEQKMVNRKVNSLEVILAPRKDDDPTPKR